jgi:hypothetical protein
VQGGLLSGVPENQAGQRLLTRCFKSQELDYLRRQPLFAKAVAQMQTLTDFEKVAALGQHLLVDRDVGIQTAEKLRSQSTRGQLSPP